ncbi:MULTISPECIES: hypothetical protein [Streptomyces]|uniref:Hydrophobic protein n=2 Tax=Streptomyces TaxID=1883 RepID=A0ABV9II00_9ACTN
MTVALVVALLVLVLVVGGCVCVVWASRGGPRWVRWIATATLLLGEVVRAPGRGNNQSGGDGD